jgi:hypothetical protein
MAVRVILGPRRTPRGRPVLGTEDWICTCYLTHGRLPDPRERAFDRGWVSAGPWLFNASCRDFINVI